MTKKEFRSSVSSTVKRVMHEYGMRYQDICIHREFPMFSIMDRRQFSAQGEDAQELLDGADRCAKVTGLSTKTCLLRYLESAGAL